MEKNIEERLPNITALLYDDVHKFVLEQTKCTKYNHDVRVLEHKLLFIVDALSLFIYGTPFFKTNFCAREKGPTENNLKNIQKGKDYNYKYKPEENYEIYNLSKRIAKNIFKLVAEAINKKLIPFDKDTLSDLTHNEIWKEKYDNYSKSKEANFAKKCEDKYSDDEIFSFAVNELNKQYPAFVEYVKDGCKLV